VIIENDLMQRKENWENEEELESPLRGL